MPLAAGTKQALAYLVASALDFFAAGATGKRAHELCETGPALVAVVADKDQIRPHRPGNRHGRQHVRATLHGLTGTARSSKALYRRGLLRPVALARPGDHGALSGAEGVPRSPLGSGGTMVTRKDRSVFAGPA